MNPNDQKYRNFVLPSEMLETADVVASFDVNRSREIAQAASKLGRLMITGEGSSRIFPGKNAVRKSLAWGLDLFTVTDGARQAASYDLSKFVTIAASNSGRTKEVVMLLKQLRNNNLNHCFGLTSNAENLLNDLTAKTFVLSCGFEKSVAATKSVVEQALFNLSVLYHVAGRDMAADLASLPDKIRHALTMPLPPEVIAAAATARTIYYAGPNDGVAEELTLKTNEIARKPADFLEGTYAVHGIEEVMDAGDLVVVIDPIPDEMPKFKQVLADGVGMTVVAISTQPTVLPTIIVPDAGEMTSLIYLMAGWNLLVETGLALNVNLDKPQRARKVGNEFAG